MKYSDPQNLLHWSKVLHGKELPQLLFQILDPSTILSDNQHVVHIEEEDDEIVLRKSLDKDKVVESCLMGLLFLGQLNQLKGSPVSVSRTYSFTGRCRRTEHLSLDAVSQGSPRPVEVPDLQPDSPEALELPHHCCLPSLVRRPRTQELAPFISRNMNKGFATKCPKMVVSWLLSGLDPFGTSPSKGLLDNRLIMWAAIFKASAQKDPESLASNNKHLTLSIRVRFILSATPINCGVFGGVL
ncbi:hypothetical protein Nepgr_024891 [Nepenthes gracilis]|uniref:Uncharacterized protein n=1 Tax=Nepenthes gracilis TaxID=150966 RepID=A0AAD3T556_NEPGR|nr:hypothetical protein Nepgr_024891 [Nepenthes gracilis]